MAERHQADVQPPLAGWFGHAEPLAFARDYVPAAGISRYQCGTPPILGLAALEVGVDGVAAAGAGAISAKSVAVTELFMELVERHCAGDGFEIITPRDAAARGTRCRCATSTATPSCRR